jgi:ParB family chromosome partitioning protein
MKAFKSLGETEIPAMVIDVDDDDAFIMSLAENIALGSSAQSNCLLEFNACVIKDMTKKLLQKKPV